jgi:hypothetical protein
MNIELPDTITVPLGRNGKYGSRDVSVVAFSADIHRYAYEYGLRQIINDAMADKTDDDGNALAPEVIVAKADKRIDALMAGTIKQRGVGSTEPLDPIEAEAWRIAKADLVARTKEIKTPKGLKGDAALLARVNVSRNSRRLSEFETLANAIEGMIAAVPAIMKKAQQNVKDREARVAAAGEFV